MVEKEQQEQQTPLLRQPPGPPPADGSRYKLTSPRGGATLATRTWAPPTTTQIKAVVLLVHGGGWHSGYYGPLANRLTAEGLFIAAYDQPGCGYSEADPTAPNGHLHVLVPDDLVDEVYEAMDWALLEAAAVTGDRKSSSSMPLFLLGESLGGALVLLAAMEKATFRQRRINLQGVIGLGTMLRAHADMLPPPLLVRILVYLARYYPRLALPATDFESTFDEAFGDPQWAQVARRDPKICVSPKFTLGFATALLSSGDRLLQEAAQSFPVPLLAIHGARDCRTQCAAVQEFVDEVGPEKAQLVQIDTNGHQLLQDVPDKTQAVIEKRLCGFKSVYRRHYPFPNTGERSASLVDLSRGKIQEIRLDCFIFKIKGHSDNGSRKPFKLLLLLFSLSLSLSMQELIHVVVENNLYRLVEVILIGGD